MNISNLARRLEDFAAVEEEARERSRQTPRIAVVATPAAPSRRRPMLENRRIGIRDSGLRQFRVF